VTSGNDPNRNNFRAYSAQTADVTRDQPDTSGRCPGVCQIGVHRDTAVERVTAQAGALAMGGHEVVVLCHRPVDNEATKVVFRVSSQFLLGPRCGHRGSEVPSSGCLAWSCLFVSLVSNCVQSRTDETRVRTERGDLDAAGGGAGRASPR
jgi:hypothetical protein